MNDQKIGTKKSLAIIQAVKNPINFFTLVVLITEGILGGLAIRAHGNDFTLIIFGMLIILFLLIGIVAFRKPAITTSELQEDKPNSEVSLKNILPSDGSVYLKLSTVKDTLGNPSVRESDRDVEKILSISVDAEDPKGGFNFSNPEGHLIVVGSPRYNQYATKIQMLFDLPYQFVYASYDANVTERFLRVVTVNGDEFSSSRDQRIRLEGFEVDYAVLFVGLLDKKKRLIWFGGIHGAGTIGVADYLKKNGGSIYKDFEKINEANTGTIYLFRVQYVQGSPDDKPTINKVEMIGNPSYCKMKPKNDMPTILVCDLGNVLMYFDRTRTYRSIAHVLEQSYKKIREIIEGTDLRDRYELGLINDVEFINELKEIISKKTGISQEQISGPLLKEFWGNIFWLNRPMLEATKWLKKQGIKLVLFSNTNSIHFEYIKKDYPDWLNFSMFLFCHMKKKWIKPIKLFLKKQSKQLIHW